MSVEGAYVYKGVSVELYDQWFSDTDSSEDLLFFESFLIKNGGKALEIGSGTGRLLLPYLAKGFDVHGLEPSEQMASVCALKADRVGLSPVIYQQYMQRLNVPHEYNTIFIPMCAFQFLVNRADVYEALRRFCLHLAPEGQLLIPLFIPSIKNSSHEQGSWCVRRMTTRPEDQAKIVLLEATQRDHFEQIENKWLRYDIYLNDLLAESHLRMMQLRWFHRYEFIMMLESLGFKDIKMYSDYTRKEASDRSDILIFSATK